MGAAPVKAKQSAVRRTLRLLGNKEKKELRAYAHQLGDDICVHQHQCQPGMQQLWIPLDLCLQLLSCDGWD
ncbi:unnamed protein product [Sphagnum troendelagicum]|uniref:Ribosomal protein S14 n=1 Tax=Sphagnum troendelagicum TaxID=128251 RepID=A0ABP0UPZ1_9BRYO